MSKIAAWFLSCVRTEEGRDESPDEMSSNNDSQFAQQCLEAHNKYRAAHGCPPLQLNKRLSAFATEWAKNLAKRNKMEHRSNNKFGENIFMGMGFQVTGEYAVKAWYDEIAKYSFAAAKFSSGTGHFTQVIWKGSKELGVGIARKGNSTWVVANYDPPGNMQGDFRDNVPPKA